MTELTVLQVTTATTLKGELETAREDILKGYLNKKKKEKDKEHNWVNENLPFLKRPRFLITY